MIDTSAISNHKTPTFLSTSGHITHEIVIFLIHRVFYTNYHSLLSSSISL
jgi:hypothetical protein